MEEQNKISRKIRKGTVLSNKMDKTVIVAVEKTIKHPRYGKVVKQRKKYYAHTDSNDIQVGDAVKIVETRPLSKMKRWRVLAE